MKISKNRYLQGFCLAVIVLGIVRAVAPRVAMSADERRVADSIRWTSDSVRWVNDSIRHAEDAIQHAEDSVRHAVRDIRAVRDSLEGARPISRFFNADGTEARRRIISVRSYSDAFPDLQEVQIVSAKKLGVSPVENREEAESRKSDLVYVASNPNYYVEPLYWSIPYLVPDAAVLLQDIGCNFLDSLQVKGLLAHKIIVTSVMRTKEEVERMRHYNGNVSENSCHMYGTTFDIAYNRYLRVEDSAQPYTKQNTVADVRLKQVLSEVLDDLRRGGRCWVKYEVKQGCFHVTVR